MTSPARFAWPDLLTALLRGDDLGYDETAWAMDQVMSGEAAPVQVAAFLVALRAKGESVAEMHGLADIMLAHARRIEVPGPSLDIVGTGGDRMNTVNISTMSSVVIASTGVRVVKHGNRAASSKSGSADVLESLGVNLTLSPEAVAAIASEAGITFCFAQTFHPSMRHAAPVRAQLGVATAFNVLGPLTNPAQPTYAAIGVAQEQMLDLMAGVFAARGKDAAVFRGDDGLDEVTVTTTSTVHWVRDGQVREHTIDPATFGIGYSPIEAIRGEDADYNAGVARRLFAGEHGPVRDAVLLNAGLALTLAGEDSGRGQGSFEADLRRGIERAAEAIDSGAAARQLERWVEVSSAYAEPA
ncbi:anthranilate phosphoribosyltransferase [Actinomycetota bacterium]